MHFTTNVFRSLYAGRQERGVAFATPQGDVIFFSSFPGTIKYNKLSRKETQE
jgi:hypothetical protein